MVWCEWLLQQPPVSWTEVEGDVYYNKVDIKGDVYYNKVPLE